MPHNKRTEHAKLPARWPQDIQYLRSYQFHQSITPAIREFIIKGSSTTDGQALPIAYRTCVAIRHISEPSHPAYGQYGLFAASQIRPNTRIIDYIGEVHCEDRLGSDYDLSLHRFPDGTSIGVDARRSGNEARFINDYRGICKKPNAVFRDNRLGSGELRMSVWSSSEGITKGDEIVVSYGKSWWRARSDEATSSST